MAVAGVGGGFGLWTTVPGFPPQFAFKQPVICGGSAASPPLMLLAQSIKNPSSENARCTHRSTGHASPLCVYSHAAGVLNISLEVFLEGGRQGLSLRIDDPENITSLLIC